MMILFSAIMVWMFAHFFFVLLGGIILWVLLHRAIHYNKFPMVCRNCGSVAPSKVMSPRNIWIEIILWFTYLIPGVIYTLWCYHNTHPVCSVCGSRDIVPADSPVGKKIIGDSARDVTLQSESLRK